ncbi:MAG: late competence development ComFB family protein [Methyloprofundus sp.]|nr:late competence development ComFB family protein [Methyloprofundus sp.]
MAFDAVHNYYEKLVFEEIAQFYDDGHLEEDEIEDIACIALNKIPPRYIRHHVDMCFFMIEQDRREMLDQVKDAVAFAYEKVQS